MNRHFRAGVRSIYTGVLAFALLLPPWAQAQIALPPVQVPNLPLPGGGLDANQPLGATTAAVQQAIDQGTQRIRALLRANPGTLEAGPRGQPVVRSEVVAFAPDDAALAAAEAAGFTVLRERELAGLDTRLVILRAPTGWSTQRALRRLRALDRDGVYDLNHVYMESAAATAGNAESAGSSPALPAASARIGLIDTGMDAGHPVFRDATIHQHGCAGGGIPAAHGTAVASLLIGRSDGFHGAAAGAELFAADVYCGAATGGAVDAVAAAFGWLAKEQVPVINVSLVGPANGVLENVVRLVIARGHVVVAAVGNDGPSAPARYPAAYAGVIGVTAVDGRDRVLLEAGRGKQVDFAAPGADMTAAGPMGALVAVRGTSFAAPLVAGLLARSIAMPDVNASQQSVSALSEQARDLGPRGVDRTYGNGLVGQHLRVAPRVAEVRSPR